MLLALSALSGFAGLSGFAAASDENANIEPTSTMQVRMILFNFVSSSGDRASTAVGCGFRLKRTSAGLVRTYLRNHLSFGPLSGAGTAAGGTIGGFPPPCVSADPPLGGFVGAASGLISDVGVTRPSASDSGGGIRLLAKELPGAQFDHP